MDSPLRNLCCYFAARYIGYGDVFPQTLAANVINMGAPLILNTFKCKHHRRNVVKVEEDGVVDTSEYCYIVMTMDLDTPDHTL